MSGTTLTNLVTTSYFSKVVNGNGGQTVTLNGTADGVSVLTVFGIGASDWIILEDNDIVDGGDNTLDWPTGSARVGLFTSAATTSNECTIRNLTIDGNSQTPSTSSSYVLGANSTNFNIDNVHIINGVAGAFGCGGIVGNTSSNATIENSSYSGTITGFGAGGICGSRCGNSGLVTINNCTSTSTLSNSQSGGIVGSYAGDSSLIIESCDHIGELTGQGSGGICGGYSINVNINACTHDGAINATAGFGGAGGIIGGYAGNEGNAAIVNSTAYGDVSGVSCGGIAGRSAGLIGVINIVNCSAGYKESIDTTYEVSGSSAGGIVGSGAGEGGECNIINCLSYYNLDFAVGGIVGASAGLSNSYTTYTTNSATTTIETPGLCNMYNCISFGSLNEGLDNNVSGGLTGGSVVNLNVSNCYSIQSGLLQATSNNIGNPTSLSSGGFYYGLNVDDVINDGTLFTEFIQDMYLLNNRTSTETEPISDTQVLIAEGEDAEISGGNEFYELARYPIIMESLNQSPYDPLPNGFTDRLNFEGNGFGDPHILSVTRKSSYDLPHTNSTYLLFDNNQKDRLIIKSLLYNPKEFNMIKTRPEKNTYFKYFKFEFNNESFIIDIDNLKFKKFTNNNDLKTLNLPDLETQQINIEGVNASKTNKIPFKTRRNKEIITETSIGMTLEFNTSKGKVTFYLVSDPLGKPILRSNIRMKLSQPNKDYEGALYKKQIKEVEF